jgi:PST family polysaccharide transporter
LKSSALIGGSSVVSIAIGIVRIKAIAVLLGPAGVGLMGLHNSIAYFGHGSIYRNREYANEQNNAKSHR